MAKNVKPNYYSHTNSCKLRTYNVIVILYVNFRFAFYNKELLNYSVKETKTRNIKMHDNFVVRSELIVNLISI